MEIQLFADGDFNEEALENRLEFFYTPTTMQCPIDGCNAGRFGSKAKYQRHWDEKHLFLTINYSCSEKLCKAVCRRKADMKQHLKKIHDIGNALKLETQLTSCKKEVRENKGFVDPGVFIFRGRTKLSTTSTSTTSLLTNTVTTMGNTSTPSFTTTPFFTVNVPPKFPETQRRPPLLPLPDLPIIPNRTPFSVTSRISLQEYKSRSQPETTTENAYSGHPALVEPNNHSGCTSTFTSSETQTSLTDLPPLVLPLIPETRPEVESLLRWLCNSMDMIGRLRESAKQKLEEIKESGSRQQEREIRRKLEAENRELRRQIAENKWRNELFQDIAKQ